LVRFRFRIRPGGKAPERVGCVRGRRVLALAGLLVAQTGWTELSQSLGQLLYTLVFLFAVYIAPVLIIYGILRAVLDAFKD
jgi:hypothetical protein